MMEERLLGRTGLRVSAIGFGCGPTAGLMINGTPAQRREAVARALALGIAYFDTAPIYGDTVSEANLGRALRGLDARPVVATKVALQPEELADIPAAVTRSVEASLQRLGVERVDVLQLHNRVAARRAPRPDVGVGALLAVEDVLGPRGVLETFRRLRDQGRARVLGCCAFGGEPAAVAAVIDSGGFDAVLVHYNILNPTAAMPAPSGFRGRDYGQVMDRAARRGMGVIVLRALEAGVLTGQVERHPLSGGAPLTSPEDRANLARAEALRFLVEGGAQTMAQAAIRFALSRPEVSTVLVGFSDVSHMEEAAAAAAVGPLPGDALARIAELHRSDFGLMATA
jgi:aryl-alcohol dehydrogenase-like predicted oxidoreductase